jgi:hypothetical protein
MTDKDAGNSEVKKELGNRIGGKSIRGQPKSHKSRQKFYERISPGDPFTTKSTFSPNNKK